MFINEITSQSNISKLLCCPFCKSDLSLEANNIGCQSCGSKFLNRKTKSGEDVLDLKINYPKQFSPDGHVKWAELQTEFEDFHEHYTDLDNEKVYLDEIDSVKEIYENEFDVKGDVLDVGGNQGRLRHFLKNNNNENIYVSIDPCHFVFDEVAAKPALKRVYPCLEEPCNFISASAENIPFKNQTFDWVHMRSVIDHFENPYFALKESYRVLRPGGKLLIGLAIEDKGHGGPLLERVSNKIKNEGIGSVVSAVDRRVKGLLKGHFDDHMFRFSDEDLKSLIVECGFEIEKSIWQKPPHDYCIYISAVKK